jgi:hypothetical protein
MLAAAILAATVLHAGAPPPAVQLANAQRAAAFHVLVLPASMRLVRAEAAHDGSVVRLQYSVEGAIIDIDERPAPPTETALPDTQGQLFNLNGYPAIYREAGAYRAPSVLTWYRADITVIVSSRDSVNEPLLVDVALGLR